MIYNENLKWERERDRKRWGLLVSTWADVCCKIKILDKEKEYVLYEWKYLPPFYFCPSHTIYHRANLGLGEFFFFLLFFKKKPTNFSGWIKDSVNSLLCKQAGAKPGKNKPVYSICLGIISVEYCIY